MVLFDLIDHRKFDQMRTINYEQCDELIEYDTTNDQRNLTIRIAISNTSLISLNCHKKTYIIITDRNIEYNFIVEEQFHFSKFVFDTRRSIDVSSNMFS